MSTSWDLMGNQGINPNTNFLGTKDNEPLIIETNGKERLRIAPDGNVGIGMPAQSRRLSIAASFDGDGIALIGSKAGIKDVGVTFVDEAGQVGTLGLASAPNAWMMGVSPGDIVLRSEHGNVRLGSGPATATTTLVITSSHCVGIGTDSPVIADNAPMKLAVSGAETTEHGGGAGIQLSNSASGGGNWYLRAGATGTKTPAGGFSIANDNDYWFTIAENGTVGIGTLPNGGKLEVNGDVRVTGDIVLTGADCAEEFDVAEAVDIEPGTVMVLDQEGRLQQSHQAYDRRVAGVVSGAGDYRPGMVLDRQQSQDSRVPIALVGKVYCKVDAQYAPIEVGDLLTTSPTAGHAMKADDPRKAFGAVIGKALCRLSNGQGLVPVLVACQ